MKNSGCDVPDYMLSLKKPSRDDRKKLAAKAPKRDGISQVSKYEKEEIRKKEEMIAASKKRKLAGTNKKNKRNKSKIAVNIQEDPDVQSEGSLD